MSVKCKDCGGRGEWQTGSSCSRCDGSGIVGSSAFGEMTCPECWGDSHAYYTSCKTCRGKGYVSEERARELGWPTEKE